MAEAYYVSKKYHMVSELAKKMAKRIARDGLLIPYLEHGRFFFNRELAQEYMDAHADVIDVVGYDEMVIQSIFMAYLVQMVQENRLS